MTLVRFQERKKNLYAWWALVSRRRNPASLLRRIIAGLENERDAIHAVALVRRCLEALPLEHVAHVAAPFEC